MREVERGRGEQGREGKERGRQGVGRGGMRLERGGGQKWRGRGRDGWSGREAKGDTGAEEGAGM